MTAHSAIEAGHINITLAEFIEQKGRTNAAILIGCTGPALLKAVIAGRAISVELAEDGTVRATETKAFPAR
ncbi:Cro/CI family transcriptional regulator [Pseudomonas fluorescens]|uniref:Uncharacterized protein n=1 Tax=Pseudomonas fluorescens TaxID=294 RepID=A0A5E7E943_PSEFL|nr:Cro/CI family transcriptional regulator [Pseudomonas fluorescens]VVO22863.1 hypothetical protein PS723_04357 [Pseudomonas fluorescens]